MCPVQQQRNLPQQMVEPFPIHSTLNQVILNKTLCAAHVERHRQAFLSKSCNYPYFSLTMPGTSTGSFSPKMKSSLVNVDELHINSGVHHPDPDGKLESESLGSGSVSASSNFFITIILPASTFANVERDMRKTLGR